MRKGEVWKRLGPKEKISKEEKNEGKSKKKAGRSTERGTRAACVHIYLVVLL